MTGLGRPSLLLLAALLGDSGSDQTCDCDASDATSPKVASIEAGLTEIQVARNEGGTPEQRFTLSALYRDTDNKLVAGRFPEAHWSLTPTSAGTVDDYGLVTVSGFPTGGSAEATVRVEKWDESTVADEVTVTRWASPDEARKKGDVVRVPHASGQPPNLVLLEENSTGTCSWGKVRAFVGAAEVGDQTQAPCSIALLSSDHAMLFEASPTFVPWSSTGGSGNAPVSPRRTIKLQVFIAVTGKTASRLSNMQLTNTAQLVTDVANAAEKVAETDVEWLQATFEANRTGITIDAHFFPLSPTTADLSAKVGAQPLDCSAPRLLPKDEQNAADPAKLAYDPDAVSVYYVDWVDYPTDPLNPGSRGLNCHYWYTGTPGPTIYVSYTRHSPITLAHELGHVLGLNHLDVPLNVMYGVVEDGPLGADARSILTVGQVFRMNVWNDSWLTTYGSVPVRMCYGTQPCPPVDLDVQ